MIFNVISCINDVYIKNRILRGISLSMPNCVDNPIKSPEVQETYKLTMLQKYGIDNPSKSEEILLKKWNKFKEKYGESYPYHVDVFYKKMRKSLGGQTRPERLLQDFFENSNIDFHYDYPVCWNNIKKRYDFFLPEYNTLIEFDGHFWHKQTIAECEYEFQKENLKNDLLKNKIAEDLGYRLIRIYGIDNINKKWDIICG